MRITFHGAAREVTGSMHLIEVNDQRILLECGMYQGRRDETYERNLKFPFDPKTINTVVLSHAHIDHSGNLPNLVKQGFAGNISIEYEYNWDNSLPEVKQCVDFVRNWKPKQ